jgi:hypothetical protein
MKKRGQLMAQPFVMLFAVIIGALVLVWGVYEINKLVNFSGDIQLTDTINNFQRVVDQYYYFNEGSSREYKINLPSKFKKICFYSHDKEWNYPGSDLNEGFIRARKNDNVFIFPIEEGSVFNITNLKPEGEENPLCFRSGEKFVITSRNNYVGVSTA